MGKEGELWDDYALINAFDNAMSNYKKLHGKKSQDNSTDGGETEENLSANIVDQNHETVREADESSNGTSNIATELGDSKNPAPVKKSNGVDTFGHEPYVDSSNDLHTQIPNGYSYSQGSEEYNQLLSHYYELEEKRQKILQQLHQFGGYSYQFPAEGYGSGVHWGTISGSQEQPVAARETSFPPCIWSCCPYASHCSVAPCSSFPACSLGETCLDKTCTDSSAVMGAGKSSPLVDGDVVKTAMNAAERAISSMKMQTCIDSGIEEKEKSKDNKGEVTQSIRSETDLGVVLNAWYSAGFYTGKYLTEQTTAKKWHG